MDTVVAGPASRTREAPGRGSEDTVSNGVQQLVDAMLDKVEAEQPHIDHTITMTPVNALFLPVHARELPARDVDGPLRGHIYRDCLVWEQEFLDHVVIVSPVVGRVPEEAWVPSYYGNLRTGDIGPFPPFVDDDE